MARRLGLTVDTTASGVDLTQTSQLAGSGDQSQTGGALPIGTRVGDCDITFVLRQSGFGVVYEAVERSSQKRVALKEYLPSTLVDRTGDGHVVVRSLRQQPAYREGMQAFLTEARTLAAVDELALVKVLRFWEENGTAYMTMPLHEGRTLKDAFRDSERPSEAWLKNMLAPLLDALASLHAANFYPCDATPDNIALRADGTPLLFDLGRARRAIANATDDVTVVLRPGFAPIEQCVQDPSMPEGPWTDVYAVAAVLYLAITRKAPPSPTARIVSDTMQPLRKVSSDYSERFLEGIDSGLAVRPENRPQTIAEFRAALGIALRRAAPISPSESASSAQPSETSESKEAIPAERGLPAPGYGRPRVRVLGDGTKIIPPSLPTPSQPYPSQAATGDRRGLPVWQLITTVFVIAALAGVGIVFWMKGSTRSAQPSRAAGTTVETSTATQAITEKTGVTRSEPIFEPAAPITTPAPQSRPGQQAPAPEPNPQAPAGAPTYSAASPNSKSPAAGGAQTGPNTSVSPVPGSSVSGPIASSRPSQSSGKIQFNVKPWGEILIDGKSRGMSPPIKELAVPEGSHRIEIRNSTFSGYASDIVVKAGSTVAITHTFKAP